MKYTTLLLISLFISYSFFGQEPAPYQAWEGKIVGPSDDGANGVVSDNDGNVYITGYFSDISDFDPSDNTAPLSSNGGRDIFVAKYDSDGNYLWAFNLGSSGDDRGHDITLDNENNILITGKSGGTIDFDPGTNTAEVTAYGGFVAKYDSDGNYIWAFTVASTNHTSLSLAVDDAGDVFVTGYFSMLIDFDPNGDGYPLTSNGGRDIYLAKYSTDGDFLWAFHVGASGNMNDDEGRDISLDEDGNVYLTGYFKSDNPVDFDPGVDEALVTGNGNHDVFVAKYDTDGNYLNAFSLGGTNDDEGNGIAIGSDGSIYITGEFNGVADFDPGAGTQNLEADGFGLDRYVAKYTNQGQYEWAEVNSNAGKSIDTDGHGNIFVGGFRTLKYSSDGVFEWELNSASSNTINSIDAKEDGSFYLAAMYAQNSWDIYVAKYLSTTYLEEYACDTYTAPDGQEYFESGEYIAYVENTGNPDSIYYVNLTYINDFITEFDFGVFTNSSSCIDDDGSVELLFDFDEDYFNHLYEELVISWDGPVSGATSLESISNHEGNSYTINDLLPGEYSLTLSDATNGCEVFEEVFTVSYDVPMQSICLVTVDDETFDHNIVVWEKPMDLAPIDSFFIYREISSNNYQKIGAVHGDSLSQFHDYEANPNSNAHRYRMTVFDICGNESELSVYHNTIHLQYQGNGNFNWNHYLIDGLSDVVGTYNFYRDDFNTGDWNIIQVVSGTQNTFSDVEYEDFPDANYRVDVNWDNDLECISTRAVSHNTSRSNVRGLSGGGGGEGDCDAPTGVMAFGIEESSADIFWSSEESSWNIAYGAQGFDPNTSGNLTQGVETIPHTLSSLDPETAYDVYVKANCDTGGQSEWSNVHAFTTDALSVEKYYNNPAIQLFPNPTSGIIEINMKNGKNINGSISVYDISGKLILSQGMNANRKIIDISSLSKGLYFVEISQTETGLVGRYKVVKE